MELVEEQAVEEAEAYPDELHDVFDMLADIYGGVQVATENDSRGRSWKKVRQYVDREDLSSDDLGHILGVLKGHDIVDQDGGRWRIAEDE